MSESFQDAAPKLEIVSCPAAVSKKLAVLVGTLEDLPERGPRLFVNEKEVPVKSGKWLVSVPLKEGVNHVTLTACNDTRKVATTSREIFCGPLPPRFEVDPYPSLTGRDSLAISGSVASASGALGTPDVTLEGFGSLPVDGHGCWAFFLKLKDGENVSRLTAKSGLASEASLELKIVRAPGAPELTFTKLPQACETPTLDIEGTLGAEGPGQAWKLSAQGKDALIEENSWFSMFLRLKPNNPPIAFTVSRDGEEYTVTKQIVFEAAPPANVIEKCEPGMKTGTYKITGKATDGHGSIASVSFNGKELRHEGGAWTAFLPVVVGFNPFEAVSVNSAGKSHVLRGSVFVEPGPPVIELTECPKAVKAASVVVRGVVRDTGSEAAPAVFVNDYPAKLNASGEWKMELDIAQGANPVRVFAKSATGKTALLETQIECTLAVPVLKVLNCPKTATSPSLTLRGFARGEFEGSGKPVTVTVNGEEADFSEGKWSFEATLAPGENRFVISAVNDDGVRTEDVRTVRLEA
jgi:hypothetical protein